MSTYISSTTFLHNNTTLNLSRLFTGCRDAPACVDIFNVTKNTSSKSNMEVFIGIRIFLLTRPKYNYLVIREGFKQAVVVGSYAGHITIHWLQNVLRNSKLLLCSFFEIIQFYEHWSFKTWRKFFIFSLFLNFCPLLLKLTVLIFDFCNFEIVSTIFVLFNFLLFLNNLSWYYPMEMSCLICNDLYFFKSSYKKEKRHFLETQALFHSAVSKTIFIINFSKTKETSVLNIFSLHRM